MKLTFLGTGTSCGVPVIGCQCEVCRSTDARDKRLRTSALVETDDACILIDCGPDFYHQALRFMPEFKKIDAVLLTHKHYDHVGGLDDIRPFFYSFGDIQVYANDDTASAIHRTMPYSFGDDLYPGVPRLNLNIAKEHEEISIGSIRVMPFCVMHKALPIFAYRIGDKLAYITDMKTIDDSELPYLLGIEILIVNALRFAKDHPAHLLVDEAIAFSRLLSERNIAAGFPPISQTFFIHTTHDIGLHDCANQRLPEGFQFAYDGLSVTI